jgi:hypothetical protein
MEKRSLTFTRDARGDAAYIYLRHPLAKSDIARTEFADIDSPQGSTMILSFDEYDRLISIELSGASRLLPPELLE